MEIFLYSYVLLYQINKNNKIIFCILKRAKIDTKTIMYSNKHFMTKIKKIVLFSYNIFDSGI